ncbi:MAG: DUF3732 domain-containing protein [Pseudomonadota bacterium]
MKFAIDTITLWSHRNEKRQLHFKRGKVNVLTGGSHRGKSAILDILDYCFLGSTHKIPLDIINDNTSWYGLTFAINEKNYTVARQSPNGNTVSKEVYFSSVGNIPDQPTSNIAIEELKLILEAEFKIDEAVRLAYGGGALRSGSKVSFRYFFLFNTVSEDIITSRETYFDKQNEDRYREALPRIFDLAMGIDTLQNIANREKKEKLERELVKEERRSNRIERGRSDFDGELRQLAAHAAAFGLPAIDERKLSSETLKASLQEARTSDNGDAVHQHSQVSAAIFDLDRRLRKLRLLSSEVKRYKSQSAETYDSLIPITEILAQSEYVVKSSIFDSLIASIRSDLAAVKKVTQKNSPVEVQVRSIQNKLLNERAKLVEQQKALPAAPESFETEKQKWLFVGETLGRLETLFPTAPENTEPQSNLVGSLQSQIDDISVEDVQTKRNAVLSLINEIAATLLKQTGDALYNYATWHPEFVYNEKRLRLRKPLSSVIENVGSSSNHMFMHLLHFLSLHAVALVEKSPFIPAFLIIDQPSRPYYPSEVPMDGVQLKSEDGELVRVAFELLDGFVKEMRDVHAHEFQMIVFEHVNADAFQGLENVQVLPEFRGSERLIPESWYLGQQPPP